MSKHFTGHGRPSNTLGTDGDSYRDADTDDIYRRWGGAYILVADRAGPVGGSTSGGETGPPGPAGPTGPAGPAGGPGGGSASGPLPPGHDGVDGEDGAPGPPGPTGRQGAAGGTGPVGPAGARSDGIDGTDGEDGAPGPPGPAGPAGASIFLTSGFRLTTESGVPVSTSDRTAQGTVYLTPFSGGQIALYDGVSAWSVVTSAEVSLALSSLTSGKNYDVFAWNNAGTVTLELSAAWTNDTTRADAVTRQNGVMVKSGATTRRLVGTIRTTGTTTTEDSSTKRFVWNRDNQAIRWMQVTESTATWTYTSGTIRQANGAAGNKVEYVTGDASQFVDARVIGLGGVTSASSRNAVVGLGIDSITAFSGVRGTIYTTSGTMQCNAIGQYAGHPGLGYHYVAWLEKGSDGTCVFQSNVIDNLSGLTATLEC